MFDRKEICLISTKKYEWTDKTHNTKEKLGKIVKDYNNNKF